MRILLLLGLVTLHVAMSDAKAVSAPLEPRTVVTRSINTFSNNFFKATTENKDGNVVCSPLSASMAFSMAAYGAGGETESKLRSVLALPGDDTVAKTGIRSIIDSFANFKGVELRLANKIFLGSTFKPKTEFLSVTKDIFRAEAQKVDFEKPVEASKTINQWCEDKTNNRIKDVIDPKNLKPGTLFVVVNAAYFHAQWVNEFDPRHTRMSLFHLNEKASKKVSTMYRSVYSRYGELPQVDARFIELPYKTENENDAASMMIILPNKINGLAELEKNLDKVVVDELLRATEQGVRLSLPKFKIESSIDLKQPLTNMGLGDMFIDGKANFTGIHDKAQIFVGSAVQKTFIEVNEKGTEAASITEWEGLAGASLPPPTVFNVDRPFVCMIVMNGVKVFEARVVEPTLN